MSPLDIPWRYRPRMWDRSPLVSISPIATSSVSQQLSADHPSRCNDPLNRPPDNGHYSTRVRQGPPEPPKGARAPAPQRTISAPASALATNSTRANAPAARAPTSSAWASLRHSPAMVGPLPLRTPPPPPPPPTP